MGANDATRKARADARALVADPVINAKNAARDAIPLLIRLGDFIGNADGRCDVILALRDIVDEETK